MNMRSNDLKNRDDVRALLQRAIQDDDREGFAQAFNDMLDVIAGDIRAEFEQSMADQAQDADSRILSARGVRQLTSAERNYYEQIITAMNSRNPKQALADLDVVMPKTTIDAVFDQLRTNHPLLSHINFMPAGGVTEMIVNTNGYQEAAWGQLCDKIVKELTSGFKLIDTTLLKLSAFMPVCKAMLDLGPEWLDRYVREILYEALANGMEAGIVTGDGNEKPIGMNRQVGEGVTVTGGVYPEKEKIAVTDFSPETVGNLLALMCMDENGKARRADNLLLIVNPQDYYQRIMPATTLMAPDGSYRNDVMPYPMTVVQSVALERGEAILGIGSRYFATAGMAREGRIEYSDHYRFLEDQRVYLIKTYANGMPLDNNAFLHLDVSGIRPAILRVQTQDAPTASSDATLSDLRIGSLTLSPAFAAATTSYTATTTNATNTITATPADAGATIDVKVGSTPVDNGAAATWADGSNIVTVTVTAADGTTTKAYTVTVTKS